MKIILALFALFAASLQAQTLSLEISWPHPGAQQFNVYEQSVDSTWALVKQSVSPAAGQNAPNSVVIADIPITKHTYRVTAANNIGGQWIESPPSPSATFDAGLPEAPGAPTFKVVGIKAAQVTVHVQAATKVVRDVP